ncbi:hypothetical protein KPL70_023499 [Citrus sinensis]|nr:hypothetical protein KPL70_023499 [Citrus sinensis]
MSSAIYPGSNPELNKTTSFWLLFLVLFASVERSRFSQTKANVFVFCNKTSLFLIPYLSYFLITPILKTHQSHEYAELRESRLRRKIIGEEDETDEAYEPKRSPLKKQVKFQGILTVPDFSATLRKENWKPAGGALELTPPVKNWWKMNGNLSNSRGSKSANAGEKKGMMARKSYASIEELKGMSMGVAKDKSERIINNRKQVN